MMDVIYQGTTWRRTVDISDDLGNPVDPTSMTAVLCPSTPITVTQLAPGQYDLSLNESTTATLLLGTTQWEFYGRVNSDLVPLVIRRALIEQTCL
jgi:hypothetical protein